MKPVFGFAPDADPTAGSILTDCSQLIPCELGMRPAPSISVVGSAPPDGEVRGALAAINLSGSRIAIVGTDSKLYRLSGSAWTDETGASVIDLGSDERWSMAQFANSTIASALTCGMHISNGGDFAPVDDAPKAKIVLSIKGFVMAFNTEDDTYGVAADRWWCSAYLNASDWTPNVSTMCTTGRLVESGGAITAAQRLGEAAIVYKRRSVFVGRYTGPAEVWNFAQVDSEVGCVGQEALCDTGKAHYFIGDDDIYAFDGVQCKSIVRGVLRDWFVTMRDPKHMHKSMVFWDKQQELAWFFFPSVYGAGAVDCCLVYHPGSGRWGRADSAMRALMRYVTPSATYDEGSPLVGSYNTGPALSYDSPFWTESQEMMAGFDASNQLVTFNGPPTNASFTTGDFGDEDQHTMCDRLVLRLKQAPEQAVCTGFTKDDGGRQAQQASQSIRDDGAFDMRQRGRWHSFKVQSYGDMVLLGLRPRLKQAGYR